MTESSHALLQMLDAKAVAVFVKKVNEQKASRIPLIHLWVMFDAAFLVQPSGPERRSWLLAVLQEAQRLEILAFPSQKRREHWDLLTPSLPLWVRRMRKKVGGERVATWKTFPWHAQLAWIAELDRLTEEQELFLLRVQKELVQGTFQEMAPIAYRSLQLTKNEKRLKELAESALFRPGRLNYEFLGCVSDIPPFAFEVISETPRALILENASSFRAALHVLKTCNPSPYGLIGFGGGAAFEQAVLHFQFLSHPVERIEYLGDLDRPGLRTARAASLHAQEVALPLLLPAAGLHEAMLLSSEAFGRPKGLEYLPQEKGSRPDDVLLVSWLPEQVRQQVLTMLQRGYRIPEEVLGFRELMRVWSLQGL